MRKTISNPILNLFLFLITISSYTQQASEENNAKLSRQIEENDKRLKILRKEDSLQKILKEQSGDINSATSASPKTDVLNNEYGQIGNSDLNQDMSQQPVAKNADDVDRSSISKLFDSIPSEFIYFFWGIVSILIINLIFRKKE